MERLQWLAMKRLSEAKSASWYRYGDLNPGYQDENLASWTRLDDSGIEKERRRSIDDLLFLTNPVEHFPTAP